MLLKNADGTLILLSMLCTHVCCEWSYMPSNNVINCPCHGSVFDSAGNVLRGPAGSPLPSVELTVDGSGYIYPSGIKGYGPRVR
jgi:cytochrome b6-f complex iron-sulfur subunit